MCPCPYICVHDRFELCPWSYPWSNTATAACLWSSYPLLVVKKQVLAMASGSRYCDPIWSTFTPSKASCITVLWWWDEVPKLLSSSTVISLDTVCLLSRARSASARFTVQNRRLDLYFKSLSHISEKLDDQIFNGVSIYSPTQCSMNQCQSAIMFIL